MRESSRIQPRNRRVGRQRHKCAPDVAHPVHPPILDLKRQKNPAGAQYPVDFFEGLILQFIRAQMMKHQNRNGRRKSFVWERQVRRIALNHAGIRAADARSQSRRKRVIVFETRYPTRSQAQFFRRRPRPRTQFQNMLAEFRAFKNPR